MTDTSLRSARRCHGLTFRRLHFGLIVLSWVVGAFPQSQLFAADPPAFTIQPLSQAVEAGNILTFEVSATGDPAVEYQWFKNSTLVTNAILPTLGFNPVALGDSGHYFVLASNATGLALSSNVVLAVRLPGAPIIRVDDELVVGVVDKIATAQLTLTSSFTNGVIFYSLDGSVPGSNSPIYLGPIAVNTNCLVRALGLSLDANDSVEAPPVEVNIIPAYAITLAVNGGGFITSTPSVGTYPSNSIVSLTATASNGWAFLYWQGDVAGADNPIQLTVDVPKNVSAVFGTTLNTVAIGAGTIELSVTNPVVNGTLASLTATADAGWVFDHWIGDATGNTNPLSLVVDGPKMVQAVFVPLYAVTATTAGGGNVELDPSAGPFPSNNVVSLTATPSNGWTFMYWQGDASGADNPLSLTINGTKNISAVFGTIPTSEEVGPGRVELSVTNLVAYGTMIQATAVPAPGRYFLQWDGILSGTNNPAEFLVVSLNPVRAVFGTVPAGKATLTVRKSGVGFVYFTPQRQFYDLGETVTLMAMQIDAVHDFNGWSGDVTSTTNPLVLTLDGSKDITANFSLHASDLEIAPLGNSVQLSWPASQLYPFLESTTNQLDAAIWTTLSSGPFSKSGSILYIDLPATNGQQFFRLRESVSAPRTPVFQYAIFFNGQLEFTQTAPLVVGGRTHANGPICLGPASGNSLQFLGTVTTTSLILKSNLGGYSTSSFGSVSYKGSPPSMTNVAALNLPTGSSNSPAAAREIINVPPDGESAASAIGQQRFYNKASVLILVSNTTVTLTVKDQGAKSGTSTAYIYDSSIYSPSANSNLVRALPFLSLTNTFTDYREASKRVRTTQINMGVLKNWLVTNSLVLSRYPSGSGSYPNIMYVGDFRTVSTNLYAVRVMNGASIPTNGPSFGLATGLTLATPNPIYVWGDYNAPNIAHRGTTNTTATFPAALIADALTVLSTNWVDVTYGTTAAFASRPAGNTTINAAIIAGTVYSTGPAVGQWSGGVHNLPRLLEDWSGRTLTLNTSLVNLYNSVRATNQFQNPGNYYNAPSRNISLDQNFLIPAKLPPGTPSVSPAP